MEQQSWWITDFEGQKAQAQARMRVEQKPPLVEKALEELLNMEEAELRGLPTPRYPLTPSPTR